MQSNNLFIRADADAQMGAGHVMRCLALAQAWQSAGGKAFFAAASLPASMYRLLQSEGLEVIRLSGRPGSLDDARHASSLARDLDAFWVVVDGYHFGADYQRAQKEKGLKLLFIDDTGHAGRYVADLVLNQNLFAHESLYRNRDKETRLLLGSRYVLLRQEFINWRDWRREIPEAACKVLVTLGGADPDNITRKVIEALQRLDIRDLEVVVVIGASNPHYESLRQDTDDAAFPVRLLRNTMNMAALMARAHVAVSAGGCTCWELAFLGLPSLITPVADNQVPVAEALDKAGAGVNLGGSENLTPTMIAGALSSLLSNTAMRTQMAQRGQSLVDGSGALRVLSHLKAEELRLRQVHEDDCELLWNWANDPQVRAVSFSPGPIEWNQHLSWFTERINDPRCRFYLATDTEGMPIGQVRFDITGNEALISISIDRRHRGRGYGSQIIELASQKVLDNSRIDGIHAYIRQTNSASCRAFAKAGFRELGPTVVQGQEARHLLLKKVESKP